MSIKQKTKSWANCKERRFLTVGHRNQKTETVCLDEAHAVENASSTIVTAIVQNQDGTIHTDKTAVNQTTTITNTLRRSQTISHSEENHITSRKNEIPAEPSSEHEFPFGKLD